MPSGKIPWSIDRILKPDHPSLLNYMIMCKFILYQTDKSHAWCNIKKTSKLYLESSNFKITSTLPPNRQVQSYLQHRWFRYTVFMDELKSHWLLSNNWVSAAFGQLLKPLREIQRDAPADTATKTSRINTTCTTGLVTETCTSESGTLI